MISSLDFEVEQVPVPAVAVAGFEPFEAPLPDDAPQAFAEAFRGARKAGKPLVIDFWASWCPPCIKLKTETLADPMVASALEGVEVIFVDLDEHPGLAAAYGVSSVPDVFFVDAGGEVTDRLRAFEEPGLFLERISKWLGQTKTASLGVETSVPSARVAKDLDLENKVRVRGRFVDTVDPDGPLAAAGIVAGDVLLQLDDNELYSADDIKDFLGVSNPGDRISVRFKRTGESEVLQVTVVLGSQASRLDDDMLRWQFAGLGQLSSALDEARLKKQQVMVGLSGAET